MLLSNQHLYSSFVNLPWWELRVGLVGILFGVREIGLGVPPEESWVSLIGVIKVLSSKVMSMFQFHVVGAQSVVQKSLVPRGD